MRFFRQFNRLNYSTHCHVSDLNFASSNYLSKCIRSFSTYFFPPIPVFLFSHCLLSAAPQTTALFRCLGMECELTVSKESFCSREINGTSKSVSDNNTNQMLFTLANGTISVYVSVCVCVFARVGVALFAFLGF